MGIRGLMNLMGPISRKKKNDENVVEKGTRASSVEKVRVRRKGNENEVPKQLGGA